MEDVTLSQLFREYEMFKTVKAVTKTKARVAFRHLVAFAGDTPVRQLGPGRINKWQTWLATQATNHRTKRPGLEAATVKTTVGAAAQVFGWALRQREADGRNEYGLTANPFGDAEPVKVDRRRVRYYAEAEVRDLLHAAGDLRWRNDPSKTLAWYAAIQLAASSGLRKNEITTRRWCDFDLDRGLVKIEHRRDNPGHWWAWVCKGGQEGEVPLSDACWASLSRLRKVRPWDCPFVPWPRWQDLMARRWPLPEAVRDNPVWNWSRDFRRILRAANRRRPEGEQIPYGDFHQLRKSLGTWLAERRVPEHYVQATLRHASANTTRDYYVGINERQCVATVRQEINAIDL